MTTYASAATRFWQKVAKGRGCWRWTGAKCSGYGILNVDGVKTYAHRFSLVLHGVKLPPALVVDHLCRNRSCVNPKHLELVTRGENWTRGIRDIMAGAPRFKHTPGDP